MWIELLQISEEPCDRKEGVSFLSVVGDLRGDMGL
jgi:hypothetical protein